MLISDRKFIFNFKGSDPNPGPAKYGMPRQFGKKRNKQAYKKISPEYSFGYRTKNTFDDRVPGPKYTLPPLLGDDARQFVVKKGPSYSL